MHIPRYWAKAEKPELPPHSDTYQFRAWASSEISEEDAYQRALERLARIEWHFDHCDFSDEYAYGRAPAREELLEELTDHNSQTIAVVTRNRYGCRVLNAARCMFLDIDIPPQGWLDRIFAWFKGSTAGNAETILSDLRTKLEDVPRASFRIYRTAAGYRVMATDREYEPTSAEVQQMMKALRVDKAYIKLCRIQECFRARISPKSWRAGIERSHFKFPCQTADQERDRNDWIDRYERMIGGHATCLFLETIGDDKVHPNILHLMNFHDHACRATSSLPLA